jgi:hypothetical protein
VRRTIASLMEREAVRWIANPNAWRRKIDCDAPIDSVSLRPETPPCQELGSSHGLRRGPATCRLRGSLGGILRHRVYALKGTAWGAVLSKSTVSPSSAFPPPSRLSVGGKYTSSRTRDRLWTDRSRDQTVVDRCRSWSTCLG